MLSSMLFWALTSLWVTVVRGYASPMSCSGTCTNAHDPSIIKRSDGTYFRFSTGNKIAIHSAPSIQGPWTYKGAAIPACSSIQLSGNCDLWAPDVYNFGGVYYLYYSVSSFGSQNSAIGVATSKTLDAGSWTDLGATGVASVQGSPYNAIDGNLFCEASNCRMTFGSFWNDIYQVSMKSPPSTAASGQTPNQVAFNPAGTHAVEGAFLFKYGNYYYLFYSAGSCCGYDTNRPAAGDEYKVKVCRSSSATGGFVDRSGKDCKQGGGTIVLESHDFVYGPGGQSVYQDSQLGPVIAYHYVDTRIGYADGQKQFGLNKVDFSSGWPVV